jgi:hypothetical protein
MGMGSNLKSRWPVAPPSPKPSAHTPDKHDMVDQSPPQKPEARSFRYEAGLASSRLSLAPSVRSAQSSYWDDIKHEVMVNYLYQQQCSRLWVSDGCGEIEGVLLRKARNQYLACPPALANSVFAMACADLNVQVQISECCNEG